MSLLAVPSLPAWGATATFSGTLKDTPISATVDVTKQKDIPYVSLRDLSRQLGAGFSVSDDRVQVDLGGNTAWLRYGETEVYGSLKQTTLLYPLVRDGSDTLLSEGDVIPLFNTCFRVSLTRKDHTAQTPGTKTTPSNAEDPFAPNVLEPVQIKKPKPGASQPTETDQAPSAPSTPSTDVVSSPAPLPSSGSTTTPAPTSSIHRIVVDPGHGGSETGAVGSDGLQEKALTLAVALQLKKDLEKTLGADVVLTRSDDRELTSTQRSNIGVREAPDLFISLHAGASTSTTAVGFEIFCPPPVVRGMGNPSLSNADKHLAAQIENHLRTTTQAASRGIRTAPIRVLREQEKLSLLIELGCITNPTEEALLASPDYQAKLAQGIADGIAAYAQSAQSGR